MNKCIRVLLVDDHQLVRCGIRALLTSTAQIAVVGEAADGVEAVHKAHVLQPDVILMDLLLPRKTGIEAIVEIKQQAPLARILVLTSATDDEHVVAALKAGVQGYLLKETAMPELLQAIHAVYRGESALHPAVAHGLVQKFTHPAALPPSDEALSERETEVLVLMAHGHSNKAISRKLSIREHTVRTHVSNILSKLHLVNRTQATLYALREGLTQLDNQDAGGDFSHIPSGNLTPHDR